MMHIRCLKRDKKKMLMIYLKEQNSVGGKIIIFSHSEMIQILQVFRALNHNCFAYVIHFSYLFNIKVVIMINLFLCNAIKTKT